MLGFGASYIRDLTVLLISISHRRHPYSFRLSCSTHFFGSSFWEIDVYGWHFFSHEEFLCFWETYWTFYIIEIYLRSFTLLSEPVSAQSAVDIEYDKITKYLMAWHCMNWISTGLLELLETVQKSRYLQRNVLIGILQHWYGMQRAANDMSSEMSSAAIRINQHSISAPMRSFFWQPSDKFDG